MRSTEKEKAPAGQAAAANVDGEIVRIDDRTAAIVYFLITCDGWCRGFPDEIAREMNQRVFNSESTIFEITPVEVGCKLRDYADIFNSIFLFTSKKYGSRTRYEFAGIKPENDRAGIDAIRSAVLSKFKRKYTRHISPFLIAAAIDPESAATNE